MGRATVTLGTRRHPSPAARRRAAREGLTAAGVLPTYDLLYGSQAGLFYEEHVRDAGFRETAELWWPTEARALDPHFGVFRDGDHAAVYRLPDGTLCHVRLREDSIAVSLAGPTRAAVEKAAGTFRSLYPASFVNTEGDQRVPVTFWANGRFGPQPRLRRIEATTWEPIVSNYPAAVRDELAALMAWREGPAAEGQLILWQGPPGTGKTWALRALASEWAPWAEFNYITDPDSFFVDDPSYMVEVLLSDSYAVMDAADGSVFEEQAEGKWRVLILEDTGELLSANAKEKYGQGLSRLLNVVDGMIGQGLRVLCLVTTNDELGELNEAVRRPGRCASQIVFGPLDADEAQAWTGDPSATAGTIAELYSRHGKLEPRPADFEEEPEDARDLMADAVVRDSILRPTLDVAWYADGRVEAIDHDAIRAAIARVAADHQEEAVGYGETAWDAAAKTVLYVCGDWTDPDPIGEDMLAIDGVEGFAHEAEALPEGWWDAEVVYPDPPPRWVVEREEDALEAVVALAAEPLLLEEPRDLLAAVRDRVPDDAPPSALEAALAALAAAHARTVEGIGALVASAGAQEGTARGNELALRTLAVLERFAARPADPAPQVTVNVPERETHVHVPAQEPAAAPVVHIDLPDPAPQPAPRVEVVVPAQPAPVTHVHVAAPEPAAAPVVHFDVNVPAQPAPHVEVVVPPRPAGAVRVEFDEDGNKVFVPVELEEVPA